MAERPLTDADRAARVVSDQIVALGVNGGPGQRRTDQPVTDEIILLTSLTDVPAEIIAALYEAHWTIEGHLRSLKIALGMDVLKSQTVEGVKKEVLLFAGAYNLVRKTMQTAADQQHVTADRISFTDALRWLLQARPGEAVPLLLVVPPRPGRWQPRVKKRRPKQYRLMTKPRGILRKQLKSCGKALN